MVKNLPTKAGEAGEVGAIPGWGRSPEVRKWQPTPVFLPGKLHGQRSLAGYSPWRKLQLKRHFEKRCHQASPAVEVNLS